jgi:hypothetical protein
MPERPTWRDDTAGPVQEDLDALATAAFEEAERLLGRQRDFAPFAVTLRADGRQDRVAADPGPGAEAEAQVLLDGLLASVRADREALRAVGLVALVLTRGGDAVRVELEHRDGGPALVLLRPYRVARLPRRRWVRMGPVAGSFGRHRVWPGPADAS